MAQTGGSGGESQPPTPKSRSAQNGANFCGKTPLTKAEHEFLLYDDIRWIFSMF